jgi:hypothetical protein
MSVLDNPVSRGKIWGPGYTWKEAIDAHVELAKSGMGRFIASKDGVWIEAEAGRNKSYKTRLPKGAEVYALNAITSAGFAQSQYDASTYVAPSYGPAMEIGSPDSADLLRVKGFHVGHRDPGRNQAFEGRYMVAELLEAGAEYPTQTAGEDWCVVGNDIDQLIQEAVNFFELSAEEPDEPSM